jgi:hypothetical protein
VRAIAAAAFAALDLRAIAIDARALPRDLAALDAVAQAWERETRLHGTAMFLDACAVDDASSAASLAEKAAGLLVVGAERPLVGMRNPSCTVSVAKPSRDEQHALWSGYLAGRGDATAEASAALAGQFDFGAARIRVAAELAEAEEGDDVRARAWRAACASARPNLDAVARRLDGRGARDVLVLPPLQEQALRDIVAHARARTRVYEHWAMGRDTTRGLGLSALFYGPSGTGKTLAAEAIGAELGVDVYQVDLSQLVSKYIGETEKNLRAVFDAAEDGGAVLLFDECDALFGKRGEVQYGHDRYANLEVSYLLQRMEAYRGVAILTSNMRSAIDPAFFRRIRFVVAFPFPDYEQRLAIWRRSFGPQAPTENLDLAKLARLNVAGGSIRNIALYAAFLAADAGEPIRMAHLARAARVECAKLERAPTELEIGGWT